MINKQESLEKDATENINKLKYSDCLDLKELEELLKSLIPPDDVEQEIADEFFCIGNVFDSSSISEPMINCRPRHNSISAGDELLIEISNSIEELRKCLENACNLKYLVTHREADLNLMQLVNIFFS